MTTALLVFGESGQLARELARATPPAGCTVLTCSRRTGDITDFRSVMRMVAKVEPAAIINAAAYTDVDGAEDASDLAYALNATGPYNLAMAAAAAGIPLVHVSTDYVFDGLKGAPYVERDPVKPVGVYGRSKEAGERQIRAIHPRHVILRTAWVFSPFGRNFVKTMLRVGAERDRLQVVADQIGNPTAAHDLAGASLQIAGHLARHGDAPVGTYHYAGRGDTSWHGFAGEIFRQASAYSGRPAPAVDAIPSSDWPTRAPRPADTRLDCTALTQAFGLTPPAWPDSLAPVLRALYAPHDRDTTPPQ